MSRTRYRKRVVSLTLVTAVTGAALLMATPSSAERTFRHGASREVKALRDASPSVQSPSFNGVGARGTVRARAERADFLPLPAQRAPEDPTLEPWSLLAGALSVMIFIARRRRTD